MSDDLMVEGGEGKKLLDFHKTFSSSKYHHVSTHVPPGKYAKSIFRNTHYIRDY